MKLRSPDECIEKKKKNITQLEISKEIGLRTKMQVRKRADTGFEVCGGSADKKRPRISKLEQKPKVKEQVLKGAGIEEEKPALYVEIAEKLLAIINIKKGMEVIELQR